MDERREHRFASQAGLLAGGRILAAATSAVWFVVLARTLSLASFGSLALLLGLGLMMSILTDLGLTGLLADVVSDDPRAARHGARVVLGKRVVLALLASLLTGALYVIAGGEGGWWPPLVFAVSTVASVFYTTDNAIFRATGHAGIDGANEACSRLFVLAVGSVVVLGADGGLVAVVGVYAVADVLSAIVLGVVARRMSRGEVVVVDPERLALRRARSLALAGVVGTFYVRIDSWLLALLDGKRAVGKYAAAYRCFDALLLPTVALASLSIPYTSGLDGRALRDKLGRIAGLAFAVTLPLSVLTLVFAPQFVDVVFGARYASAVPALRILAAGALVSAPMGAILPALALRSGRIAVALAVSLVANVVANLAAIPAWGPTGAAAATVACETVLALWLGSRVLLIGRGEPRPTTVGPPVAPVAVERPAVPKVSVVIPVYNGERYVAETIESALAQTWRDLEVIVVDDGSTDATPSVLAGFGDRITTARQDNAGPAAARNHALTLASGDVVAILDMDDLWAADRVEQCVRLLLDDPRLGFVTTDAALVDEQGAPLGGTYQDTVPFPDGDFEREIVARNYVFISALVWRDWLDAVGGFDVRHPMGADDYELWLKLIVAGARPGVLREPLASYRLRTDSITRRDDRLEQSKYLVLEHQLPRYWAIGVYGPSRQNLRIALSAAKRGDLVTSARFVGAAFRDPDRTVWQVCTDLLRRDRTAPAPEGAEAAIR